MKMFFASLFFILASLSSQPAAHKAKAQENFNFIIHSITAELPNGTKEFKAIYGVGFVVENCVVDPISFQRATENNQMIALYLDEKYGDAWWHDLPLKPFGL